MQRLMFVPVVNPAQLDDYARDENKSLQSILDLSHEELLMLVHMERNGINVD